MTAADPDRWDALVDAAPAEIRRHLDRLRHHVGLTARHSASQAPVLDAVTAVLEWAAGQDGTS